MSKYMHVYNQLVYTHRMVKRIVTVSFGCQGAGVIWTLTDEQHTFASAIKDSGKQPTYETRTSPSFFAQLQI